ncbi:MAG TPA: hypothetical protein VHR15_13825 [Ktedonobacterales bacterium]|nr:hypothetical protein [Ktedonobacterales bacterium]
MFFQTVFTSLLVIMLGLALCFTGYRFFTILVSIWGFFAGFQFGATIFTNIFGQGFLSTVISWVVGLLVAIFAATIAYLFYAAAVVLLAGFVGYQLGIGIMAGLGFNDGWLTFLVGLLVGLAWVAVAIYLHFPKVLVLILTSLAGAELLLGGVFLALGRITLTGLRFGAVGAIVRDNWLWGLLYLAIAAIGFYFQWRTTQNFVVEEYSAENPFAATSASAATGAATGTGETAAVAATASAAPEVTPPSTATSATDLAEPASETNLDAATPDTTPVSEASETSANGTVPDVPSSAPEGAQ